MALKGIPTSSQVIKLCHSTETPQSHVRRWARRQTRLVASRILKPKKNVYGTLFFNYSGSLEVAILPQDTTMTATCYLQNVLHQVKSAINEQRPKVSTSRTLLLHDNADPHKARATTQSLQELEIQVLPHPAYSPDLAPRDF
ncbi:transposase [Elysia marginata]|uniref:Transposase n=1 Tax=Elysia marginata TaxID=1093978 RepID=A0AAV4HCM9_9GAST|nr:transposase [Elysia marginata]